MLNIHHQLIIEASPEKIYKGITSTEGLAGWWTPDATAKPEAGTVARFPFGPDYFKEMRILELTPSRFVLSLKTESFLKRNGTRLMYRWYGPPVIDQFSLNMDCAWWNL